MKRFALLVTFSLCLLTACNSEKQQGQVDSSGKINIPAPAKPEPAVDTMTATGLQIKDLKVGSGPKPFPGKRVKIHYTAMTEDRKVFDSSRDKGDPAVISLAAGSVIKGWEEGISGMRVGGKRQLTVPAGLATPGTSAVPFSMPTGKTLIFIIDLLDIEI